MKKKVLVIIVCIIAFLALVFVGFLIAHKVSGPQADTATEQFKELVENNEELYFDQDKGRVYVNNEIIVISTLDATLDDMQDLADDSGAVIGEAMEDIGVYKFVFDTAYDYNELNRIAKDLLDSEYVEDASISIASVLEEDTVEEPPYEEPRYPSDPWEEESQETASWDVDAPAGNNWGLEAINAPAGWGYLDQISTVKIGLVDTMVDMTHSDLDVKDAFLTLTSSTRGKSERVSIDNSVEPADEHGTHVAGIMAAEWNQTGVSGIMGNKTELYYSAAYNLDSNDRVVDEYVTPYNYFKAIKTLVDNDVQVINISQNTCRLIGFAASHGNRNAISYLEDQAEVAGKLLSRLITTREEEGKKDFVICVAAGNSNSIRYYVNEAATYGYEESNFFSWMEESEVGGSLAIYNNYLSLIDIEEVKDRIIVVGSIGLSDNGNFEYSYFSNVGDRVDLVAPGEEIYSLVPGGYDSFSGTSMATPHVTAAAGLVFGCNSNLNGSDVKKIVCSAVTGRFYYQDGFSGLLNLEDIMRKGLATKDNSVNRIVNSKESGGLDLCFVIDTTGSMGDDIGNAKENMSDILSALGSKTSNYRVALIDYRDFSNRSNCSQEDYPSKIQFEFTEDNDSIREGINALTLGNGGDWNETVFSGLMTSLSLDWREDAKKIIIVLGDAPPLDPEPNTNYTYEQVVAALYEADLNIDFENSDHRVLGDGEESLINVYTIGAGGLDSDAIDFFQKISDATGGTFTATSDASEVSGAIIDSIEDVEIEPLQTVKTNFGEEYSKETVELYCGDEFCFAFRLDENGSFELEDMEEGTYSWKIDRLRAEGTMKVIEGDTTAQVDDDSEWYTFVFVLWNRHRAETIIYTVLIVVLIVVAVILFKKRKKWIAKQQAERERQIEENVTDQFETGAVIQSEGADVQVVSVKPETAEIIAEVSPSSPAEMEVKFCGECGTPIDRDFVFCKNCGNKIK